MTKLIIGLGNPEPRYNLTRHNAGYWTLDRIADLAGVAFAAKPKFKANIAELSIGDERIILVKPTTYYNLSGEAARALVDFYKLASSDILIIHDDLSLDFGTIRTRIGGSDAGNNGIKSITAHVGPDTARIRVGIANDSRAQYGDADFVLAKFTTDEIIALTPLLTKITEYVDAFITGNFGHTTHKK